MKGDRTGSPCLCLGQRAALEHTAKTTANGQLACMFWAWVRGYNSSRHQVTILCIHHSQKAKDWIIFIECKEAVKNNEETTLMGGIMDTGVT